MSVRARPDDPGTSGVRSRRGRLLLRPEVVATALLTVIAVAAVLAPLLAPARPLAAVGAPLDPPSTAHLLGTNAVGQDLASQLLLGARTSLLIAAVSAVGTVVLGTLIGVSAGWFGGPVELVAMRSADAVLALPRLPLLILVAALAGPSITTLSATLVLTFWPATARILRAEVRSLRTRVYVRAAVGFGASTRFVVRRHLLPELSLILVAGLVAAAGRGVLLESGLAFLGLSEAGRASWGRTLRDAMDFSGLFFTPAWSWWLLPPLAAIVAVLLSLTLLGLAAESRINPRLARHGGRA